MLLVFGLSIILIMVRMCKTDYLQSYSPFVETRHSLKGKKETPEQCILGGCFVLNALKILHQFHISSVFSSHLNKHYHPRYFVFGYTVVWPQTLSLLLYFLFFL